MILLKISVFLGIFLPALGQQLSASPAGNLQAPTYASSVVTDGVSKIYILGGATTSLNSIQVYDYNTILTPRETALIGSFPASSLFYGSAVIKYFPFVSTDIYYLGGLKVDDDGVTTVQTVYHTNIDIWGTATTTVNDKLAGPVNMGCSIYVPGAPDMIYTVAGDTSDLILPPAYNSKVISYNPTTGKSEIKGANMMINRELQVCAQNGNNLYVAGGFDLYPEFDTSETISEGSSSAEADSLSVQMFSASSGSVTNTGFSLPNYLIYSSSVIDAVNNVMYFVGGIWGDGSYNYLSSLDLNTGNTTTYAVAGFDHPLIFTSAVFVYDQDLLWSGIYIIGGLLLDNEGNSTPTDQILFINLGFTIFQLVEVGTSVVEGGLEKILKLAPSELQIQSLRWKSETGIHVNTF